MRGKVGETVSSYVRDNHFKWILMEYWCFLGYFSSFDIYVFVFDRFRGGSIDGWSCHIVSYSIVSLGLLFRCERVVQLETFAN